MATPHRRSLPEEIVVWEILIRLRPKSLLRCRAVCRATSTRDFLLAHHARQPSLPIVLSSRYGDEICKFIHALDHRAAAPAAQLQPVARFDKKFVLEASCDGLLILSKYGGTATRFFVCNPATRQHAPIWNVRGFDILGMYPHQPTGEYRLLLKRSYLDSRRDQNGCYVHVLGSDRPPRYIGWQGATSRWFNAPARVRDNLHWYPMFDSNNTETKLLTVFNTMAESFRQMRAPIVPTKPNIFEMDDMVGIYSCNRTMDIIDLWVLQNYESEVWDLKYRVALPIAEIRGKFEGHDDGYSYVTVASGDGDMLLLVSFNYWLFYIGTDGKLVASFQDFYASQHRHKQTLVQHNFFTALDGYAAKALCFI